MYEEVIPANTCRTVGPAKSNTFNQSAPKWLTNNILLELAYRQHHNLGPMGSLSELLSHRNNHENPIYRNKLQDTERIIIGCTAYISKKQIVLSHTDSPATKEIIGKSLDDYMKSRASKQNLNEPVFKESYPLVSTHDVDKVKQHEHLVINNWRDYTYTLDTPQQVSTDIWTFLMKGNLTPLEKACEGAIYPSGHPLVMPPSFFMPNFTDYNNTLSMGLVQIQFGNECIEPGSNLISGTIARDLRYTGITHHVHIFGSQLMPYDETMAQSRQTLTHSPFDKLKL